MKMVTSHPFSAATGKVCLQWSDVVIIGSIFRRSGTCHFELLSSVRELKRCIGMRRVGKERALPLQHVRHTFEQVQKAKGQSCLS